MSFFEAKQVPELRAKVVDLLSGKSENRIEIEFRVGEDQSTTPRLGGSAKVYAYDESGCASFNAGAAGRREAEVFASIMGESVRSADLYFMTESTVDLIQQAARSLPRFSLRIEDVPSREGFAVFEDMLSSIIESGAVVGISWKVEPDDRGVTFQLYFPFHVFTGIWEMTGELPPEETSMARVQVGALVPMASGTIPFGELPWLDEEEETPEDGTTPVSPWTSGRGVASALISMFLLMAQGDVTESETVHADRAARKRLARAGVEGVQSVRCIKLRSRSARSGSTESVSREYHHQWIVRGHWRNQWYPSREGHKPKWIAPYIKGPEGAPVLGGDRVYVA